MSQVRRTQSSDEPTRRFARARRLAQMFDVSPSTIWRWASEGRIPQPVKLGPSVAAWDLDAVFAALEHRPEA